MNEPSGNLRFNLQLESTLGRTHKTRAMYNIYSVGLLSWFVVGFYLSVTIVALRTEENIQSTSTNRSEMGRRD